MTNTANYIKSKMVDQRTINYRASVTDLTDETYLELRRIVKSHNEAEAELEALGQEPHYLKVRARGRGPRIDPDTGKVFSHYTPDYLAEYFDLYIVHDLAARKRYLKRKSEKTAVTVGSIINGKAKSILNRLQNGPAKVAA